MYEKKYQFFISSTYKDLVDEREAVIKAILELYHIPIGMEMFSAEDEDQWEIIKRTIDSSDYYILILGLRYGSQIKDLGKSFTQREYEYALEKGLPVLAFVMDENVALSAKNRDDDLTAIKAFRSTVLGNQRMSMPSWKTKDELAKGVTISIVKQISRKPGIGWVRSNNQREELASELALLSKENRELRAENESFKANLVLKLPKIVVSIEPVEIDSNGEQWLSDFSKAPKSLSMNEVPEHLRGHVTQGQIDSYNKNLPSVDVFDRYYAAFVRYFRSAHQASEFNVHVANAGSTKANNLYIDLHFPPEILVFDEDEKFEPPKDPLPQNPIQSAEQAYEEAQIRSKQALDPFFVDAFSVPRMPIIPRYNQSPVSITDSGLTIKIDSLLHTRGRNFNGDVRLSALKFGRHEIRVDVICEEFANTESFVIELIVELASKKESSETLTPTLTLKPI
jgi:hypothetical protein